jgi:hypothetical protein
VRVTSAARPARSARLGNHRLVGESEKAFDAATPKALMQHKPDPFENFASSVRDLPYHAGSNKSFIPLTSGYCSPRFVEQRRTLADRQKFAFPANK